MRSVYLSIPIMLLLAIIQATILPKFPILGFVPLLALLVAVSWGLLHTVEEGVAWAFVGGFFVDLFSITPLGVTSLALMAAVAAVTLIRRNFPESRVLLPILLSFVATLVFWFVYLLILRVAVPLIVSASSELGVIALTEGTRAPGLLPELGQHYNIRQETFRYGLLMSFGHGLLILPIYWAIYTVERLLVPRRVEI